MRKAKSKEYNTIISLSLNEDGKYEFSSTIEEALDKAYADIEVIKETISSVDALKPDCDKLDYALAASSGTLCGIMDIFLVGKPGESPLGNSTDKWFEERTIDFARLCGWKGEAGNKSSAIRFLEYKFEIPYDQTGIGEPALHEIGLNPDNHHFKSLGHNPTLAGLFFSILDQFTKTSHFVSYGEFISLKMYDTGFELKGNNFPAKLFCGFVNWFGHLLSDMSGSSGSKGRGKGIPSPMWAWVNDIVAIKGAMKIQANEFDQELGNFAVKIFEKGFDLRFQAVQLIPVFVNEITVRFIYGLRRLIKYFKTTEKEERSFSLLWKSCEPFSNPSVKRMLTVSHGVSCLIDAGDATVRAFVAGAGHLDLQEFFLRLNIAGVGRFAVSLYGEADRAIILARIEASATFADRETIILTNYIEGLKELSEIYDDSDLVNFVDDFKKSDSYIHAFVKTINIAEKRKVPDEKILKTKSDIDRYFAGGKQ